MQGKIVSGARELGHARDAAVHHLAGDPTGLRWLSRGWRTQVLRYIRMGITVGGADERHSASRAGSKSTRTA
jgi:hypothetical protein